MHFLFGRDGGSRSGLLSQTYHAGALRFTEPLALLPARSTSYVLMVQKKRTHFSSLRFGRDGGSRTHMKLPSADFESAASAIPPHPVKLDYFSTKKTGLQAFLQKIDKEKSDAIFAAFCQASQNCLQIVILIATSLVFRQSSFVVVFLLFFVSKNIVNF